jgi:hypothetical protein
MYLSSTINSQFLENFFSSAVKEAHVRTLGILLAALQVTDGVLTAAGMFRLGTSMEANAMLRSLMSEIGIVPTLVIAKLLCIVIIASLVAVHKRVNWMREALLALVVTYSCLAIVPWMIILSHEL